jgi:ribonuclease Z
MSTIEPRHAVAYHALLDQGTQQYNTYYDSIRQTYDGPLSIANDLMVWNITKDNITERMAAITDNAWAVEGTARQPPPQPGIPDPMSDFIKQGEWGARLQCAEQDARRFFRGIPSSGSGLASSETLV